MILQYIVWCSSSGVMCIKYHEEEVRQRCIAYPTGNFIACETYRGNWLAGCTRGAPSCVYTIHLNYTHPLKNSADQHALLVRWCSDCCVKNCHRPRPCDCIFKQNISHSPWSPWCVLMPHAPFICCNCYVDPSKYCHGQSLQGASLVKHAGVVQLHQHQSAIWTSKRLSTSLCVGDWILWFSIPEPYKSFK